MELNTIISKNEFKISKNFHKKYIQKIEIDNLKDFTQNDNIIKIISSDGNEVNLNINELRSVGLIPEIERCNLIKGENEIKDYMSSLFND